MKKLRQKTKNKHNIISNISMQLGYLDFFNGKIYQFKLSSCLDRMGESSYNDWADGWLTGAAEVGDMREVIIFFELQRV